MRVKGLLIILLSLFCTYGSFAQSKGELTQSRILILLDESSSMIQKWPSGKEKYKAAHELILRVMDSIYAINPNVEFSLRVFGHQYTIEQKNCYDTKNEVPFSKDNRVQMALRLEDIHPLGVTPIAYALMEAAKYDLIDEDHNAYSIILITDGGESCGGDICEVMKKLMKYKVYFKPYIVSLEDDPTLKVTYSCMGDYLQVTKDSDMPVAVSTIVKAFRPLIRITKTDYKEIQTIAANAPSVLNVEIPTVKVTESEKKAPEPPKPVKPKIDTIPVVKAKDTTAPKPVTKIKVDQPPVKLTQENIPALVMVHPTNFLATPAALKAIKPATLPPVEITVAPIAENMVAIPTAEPKPFRIQESTLAQVKAVDHIPTVNIVVKEEPVHMEGLSLASPKPFAATPKPLASISTQSAPAPNIEVPSTLQPETITHLPVSQPKLLATTAPTLKNIKTVQPGNVQLPPVVIDTVPVTPKNKIEKMDRLPLAAFRHIQILIVIEEKSIVPVRLPPLPPLKIDLPKPAAPKPTPTAAKGPDVEPQKAEYTVEREDAKETSVEIYLTNGKGKFYSTTPQMLLVDPATKKIVKSFYRMVDASGNPDPITDFPPGTYNVSLSTRRSLEVSNVKIEAGKKNKIMVIVKPCTLSFQYEKAPNRPVVEFSARVIERNKAQGKITDQRCNERLEYAPGNYHIMINTFPQIDRNEDVEFDEAVISIPQPGFLKLISDGKLKTAALYKQEGDKFLYFNTLDMAEAVKQPIRIQPGMYQIHYQKGSAKIAAPDYVVSFLIKATETETIELGIK